MRHPQRRKRSQERLVVTVDPTLAALGALIADCANLEEQCQTNAICDIAAELDIAAQVDELGDDIGDDEPSS
jgi:hypothetical protein